ncbi:MAG TPA: tyrosine-type recombinase/integrase [Smithellaceae bacterium]|nr:tyrosine-type recombinase/integrase [Smithellaceae bacterium]
MTKKLLQNNILTNTAQINITLTGGYMSGTYQYDLRAKRYYVRIYWQGKDYKIYRYNGEPIWHEKTAEKLLNKIRAEIDDGAFDIRVYLPDSPLTIQAYSETWLNSSTACNNTKRVHRSAIKKAVEILGDNCLITSLNYSKFCKIQQSLDCSAKWNNAVLIALKAMLHFALKDGVIKKLPVFPPLIKTQEKDPEYLTYEKQQKVIKAIQEEHRPIFEFGMEFGLRVGEVRALKKDCIEENELVIKRSFSQWELRETTKTYRIRHLPLTTRAKEILKANRPSFSDYLFTYDGRRPYHERKMREIWKAACQAAGINIIQKNAMRHSLGCQLLDEGVDLKTVSDIYGHSTMDMTRKYVRRIPHRIFNALENRGKIIELPRVYRGNKKK